MPRSRTSVDILGSQSKLDVLAAAVKREAEVTEADPFDDATMAAVLGAVEALKAEADALAKAELRIRKLARRPL